MATLTWTSAATAAWTTSASWTPAQVPVAGDSVIFDGSGADLSIVSGVTIQNLLVNDPTALITATGVLAVQGGATIQNGTLAVASGGTVTLNDLVNLGTISIATGGQVTLTGTYDSDGVERIVGAGGTLNPQGTMLNTGKVFDTSAMGTLTTQLSVVGTIVGGTILGQSLGASLLDGVVWEGPMVVAPLVGELHIRNGLSVVQTGGGGQGHVELDGTVVFEGDSVFDQVLVEVTRAVLSHLENVIAAEGILTLGSQATLAVTGFPIAGSVHSLRLTGSGPASQIINLGTIALTTQPGGGGGSGRVTFDVSEFHNHGTVSAGTTSGFSGAFSINSLRFINEAGGLLQVLSSPGSVAAAVDFTNDGTILVSRAVMQVDSNVRGSGTILVNDTGTLDLNSGVASTQTITMNGTGVVDLATPQLFQGTITGLTQNTVLRLGVEASAISYTSNVLTMQLSGGQTFGLNILGSLTLADFNVSSGGGSTTVTTDLPAPCFAAGTRIRACAGDAEVETLRIGDRIHVQRDNRMAEVTWIGHRTVDCARHPEPRSVWPVRITANAFGPNRPARDLVLSPDHALFIEDVLVPVKHLIDGHAIAQIAVPFVTYFHVELARHEVILAEGLAVESYLDTGDRDCFANADCVIRLFPHFGAGENTVAIREARACAPLVVSGPVLDRARALLRINGQAAG